MIDQQSLSGPWLDQKQKESKKDPTIIEKMIWALYLLEQLQLSGLPFMFKGGTCLVLMMDKPLRFSVDIDIIIDPSITKEELEFYLQTVVEQSAFERVELDERRSYKGVIPKAHYNFFFISNYQNKSKEGQVIKNPEKEVLLDVLFEKTHYPATQTCSIKSDWLITQPPFVGVTTPDINSITGDKLTAFAPDTIGVPYKKEKEKEIMKQLFDLGVLFNLVDDLQLLKQSFFAMAKNEIGYRAEGQKMEPQDVLMDIINTALILNRANKQLNAEDAEKFEELNTGIDQFRHYVFVGNFRMENALLAASKAAYLAATIFKDNVGPIKRFDPELSKEDYMIKNQQYNFLNKKLKFIAKGEALFYWNETINLIAPGE